MAKEAVAAGSHPFGAVLASETGEILLRQGNIDTVNHAESTLARQAYRDFSFEELQKCTLYSTFEPCAVRVYSSVYSPTPKSVSSISFGGALPVVLGQMCAATLYWAGIGGLCYAGTEDWTPVHARLLSLGQYLSWKTRCSLRTKPSGRSDRELASDQVNTVISLCIFLEICRSNRTNKRHKPGSDSGEDNLSTCPHSENCAR